MAGDEIHWLSSNHFIHKNEIKDANIYVILFLINMP